MFDNDNIAKQFDEKTHRDENKELTFKPKLAPKTKKMFSVINRESMTRDEYSAKLATRSETKLGKI